MESLKKVIVLIETSTQGGREILCGISDYSRKHGPWIICRRLSSYLLPKSGELTMSQIRKWKASGIITRDKTHLEEMVKMGLPIILAGSLASEDLNLPTIAPNNAKIGEMGAEYFLNRGFKHFAYFGVEGVVWSIERQKSYIDVLDKAGFSCYLYGKEKKGWYSEEELSNVTEWLMSLPKPVGLMTCTDEQSQYILEACEAGKIEVPFQVAVLGVDDDKLLCNISYVPLSSINLNYYKAGYEAADLLNKLMAGEPMDGQKIIIEPSHIVSRQSTDTISTEDQEVAGAIQFIRQNCTQPIQVDDVVQAAKLSRRGLYVRFKKAVGHSIYAEIRHCRVEQIMHYLLESDLSMTQIADKMNFGDINCMSRFFKQEKKISPRGFRKKYRNYG